MGETPIGEWRAADYNRLSSQLGRQTKVYLSENTLKRIFGKLKTTERYFPQKATRDALAVFIGYRDWHEFEVAHTRQSLLPDTRVDSIEIIAEMPERERQSRAVGRVATNNHYIWLGLGFLAVLGLLFFWSASRSAVPDGLKLICDNPRGYVPHSAVFRLNDRAPDDVVFDVDFWDDAMPAHIKKRSSFTRFFKNPGVVYATLLYHGKPIDTTAVLLQTRGWVANSGNDTSNAFPVKNLHPLNPKDIYVSAQELDSAGLNLSKRFLVGFSNIKPSGINGDNFDFTCRVFAEQSRVGVQCVETTIIILGEKHRHLLKLYRSSCVALSEYKFSENYVSGANTFLGSLAFNPQNGGDIQIKVINKRVNILLNGKKVLKTSYKRSIGKVMGIKILFSGIGRAVSPTLRDLSTGEVF